MIDAYEETPNGTRERSKRCGTYRTCSVHALNAHTIDVEDYLVHVLRLISSNRRKPSRKAGQW